MAANWANRPGCKPGDDKAVNMHKSIASGMTMPASKRVVKVPGMNGGADGDVRVPGLTSGK
jgi:hypothetical protein